MMQIYNSLLKQKISFQPITPKQIKIYVCGQTVYDYCHIGHARSMIIFDMITRYFRSRDFEVLYIRNITDIDDKIIHRANQNKETVQSLTCRFIDFMHEDERALNILPPSQEPRATEYISQIISLIQMLVNSGHAYIATNGDVYFDIRKFGDYGKLSHHDIDQLRSGMRIDVVQDKQDPLDFVLWKLAKPGEPTWPSPWGAGRPGWHIECSAMATSLLGQPFDIHGGGLDLKFPHHENEIAQSEAAAGKPFANIWMHSGLLQINDEKMSKSLGNFFTIRDVLKQHSPEVLRYFMLSAHYRSPLNYTESALNQAKQALTSLYMSIRGLPILPEKNTENYSAEFNAVMDDDFNSPQAYAVLFQLAKEINRLREDNKIEMAAGLAAGLKRLSGLFGFLQQAPESFLQGERDSTEVATIDALIQKRNDARSQRAWKVADDIRKQLSAMGVSIEDGPTGTTWRKDSR